MMNKVTIFIYLLCILSLFSLPVEGALDLVQESYRDERMDILYPQIKGDTWERVNEILYEAAFEKIRDTEEELLLLFEKEELERYSFWSSYEVKYMDEMFLSIAHLQSYYREGAAHPNTYLTAVTVDLKEKRRAELHDFFIGQDPMELMERQIEEAMIARDIPLLAPFGGINPEQTFYLTNAHFVLCYQPYEYTPYAYGLLKFPISYQSLKEYLAPKAHILLENRASSLSEKEAQRLIAEASRCYDYVTRASWAKEEETFIYQGQRYRYLREDLQTEELLYQRLSPVFTREAMELGIHVLGMIEHEGRLAQVEPYSESLLPWENAKLFLLEDSYGGVEYSAHVPYHQNGSSYRITRVQFIELPQKGWRIETSFDSFY